MKFGMLTWWRFSLMGLFSALGFIRYEEDPDAGGGSHTVEMDPGGTPPSAAEGSAWYESAGLLSDASILTDKDKEYKSFDEYVKGSQSARQMAAGKGIAIPGEDATVEQKAAFKVDVMKHFPELPVAPETADAYKIEMFQGEGVGLPVERQGVIAGKFHEAGLSNTAANAVMNIYADEIATDMTEATAQMAATRKETETALKKEWAGDYDDRQAGITRVAEKFPGVMAQAKEIGLDGTREFQEMMDEVARSTAEDHPGNGGGGTVEAVDEQIKAIKANPKYKSGNSFEREELMGKLTGLYQQKKQLNK